MSNIDNLIKQIQSQGTTDKWTGGVGADAATKDMARILDSIGITDINQFGPVTKQVELYMGEGVDGTPIYQTQEEQTFGNKITGQAVPVTYSERQTGNAFGGTFEGKGNTGYRVDFTPDGKPIFYTTGASSSNAAEIIKPFAQMALLAAGIGGLEALGLGAGGGAAAGGAATGAGAAGMTAAELAQLDLALGGIGGSTGATTLGNALMTGATVPTITSLTGGSGLLTGAAGGITADSVAAKLAEGASGMGGSGLLGGAMTEAELAQLDLALGGSGGSAGAAELEAALATGAPTVTNTALTGGSGIFTGAAGGITPESVAAKLSEGSTVASTAANAAKTGLGVSDALRAASLVATIAGVNEAMKPSGSGGFPIVPIPSDWTSPIKPTGVAEFKPLAPIDFGSKEMLQGTQWEKLLDPNYGTAPAMPTSTNPSNMTFNELTRILGGSRESIPTQNLSINDVIAGIQSQYGQTPQGSMG
jgi:hypothetical protein